MQSFIETQFPVSRLSKESYKERKANYSQTLTGLGKWWGRKPLVLVRAVILGLLMPASGDPRMDRKTFLALLTMDDEGLWRRKDKNIPLKEIRRRLGPDERQEWFAPNTATGRPRLKKGLNRAERTRLQRLVFERMSYDEKLKYCKRPEHLDGPSAEAWKRINEHLGTAADTIPELILELGMRRFGRTPRVGDAFCGGGSVPFEAARIGCEAYGSDLNPVAALLTWAALNIVGGGEEAAKKVRQAQTEVFDAVDRQVTAWRIEHNDVGWRADAYLYCTETVCPECGWRVPLAPSWVIGVKSRTVAQLAAVPEERRVAIGIRSGVDRQALSAARNAGTVHASRLECPSPGCDESTASTPMSAIRGDRRGVEGRGFGLRRWEYDDLTPRPNDVLQERLYCVRWRLPALDLLLAAEQGMAPSPLPDWVRLGDAVDALAAFLDSNDKRRLVALRSRDWQREDHALDEARQALATAREAKESKSVISLAMQTVRNAAEIANDRNARLAALARLIPTALYRPADEADLDREIRALDLLRQRFSEWQEKGRVPSRHIAPGDETTRLIRERGWTHWHHLFTPRQLLVHGALAEVSATRKTSLEGAVACLLGLARLANWDSKLSRWDSGAGKELVNEVFYNQAFNTLDSFAGKGVSAMPKSWLVRVPSTVVQGPHSTAAIDARALQAQADLWITDPPYADAINYHELSEFLLSWFDSALDSLFNEWYSDSKRALAVRGNDSSFRRSMVDCYRNLTSHLADNGFQVVMFTHQDAAVWADLTLILWASGLRVTAAWTIATETESALKKGNYVQGTVLMILRKQTSGDTAFSDEVIPEVEDEVERQLNSMLELDDRDDPNFSDADYQLAAYAAALRVLTAYRSIEDIDIARELARERGRGETNPIEAIIADAVRTASNFLVPKGLPGHFWRRLGAEEKLYLKGVEIESHGESRTGVYQEFARGFGVRDYRFMLESGKANETRLRTATEFGRRELGGDGFGGSLVRQALYAIWRAVETEETADSLTWLRTELADYWHRREALVAVLRFLAALGMSHWREDAAAARLVAGAVENDHV
ncbi:MAG: DUF1156 domain-containing protein [Rhodospirillaceae bacterium]|nr:DUF1156 domain-containing protein [Rhodospirillaceae bacterium]